MAGCMNLRSTLVSILVLGASGFAHGQKDASLLDPTRPPASVQEPVVPGSPGSPGGGAESAPSHSGLQTVILGKGHKPMAVINGVMVELGDKVGEATLIKLSEFEAVLQGPAGREVLHLLPGGIRKTDSSRVQSQDGTKHD